MTVTAPRESYLDREPVPAAAVDERPVILSPVVRPRLAALDGIRGLAILSVMVVHFTAPVDGARLHLWWLWRLFGLGWVGVDLFFVLSGFLITGILLDSKGTPGYFRRFYLRRALRIFPLYYGVLALVFGVLPFLEPPSAMGTWIRAHQLWYWLYGANFLTGLTHQYPITPWYEVPHLWSLAVEEHFYLFWPLVVFGCSRRGLVRAAIGLIAFSFACRILLFPVIGPGGVYALTPCRLDGLLAGALLALAWRDEAARQTLRRWSRLVLVVSLAGVIGIFLYHRSLIPVDEPALFFGCPLITLAFAAFLSEAVACPPDAPLGRLLSGRFLGFLGRYSYGLYLFHVLFRPLFARALTELTARGMTYPLACALYFALSFAASVLIAVVSYHAFEKHFLRLKERWAGT